MMEYHLSAIKSAKDFSKQNDDMGLAEFCKTFDVVSITKEAAGDVLMTVKLNDFSYAELHTNRDIMNKVRTSSEYVTTMSIMLPSATFRGLYALANDDSVVTGGISI